MGELVFVGLGLGDRGVSLAGVDAIKAADLAYFERYTSPPSPTLVADLEAAAGKKVLTVGREFVEDGKEILEKASKSKVVLAVQGDPMVATTHSDLRVRAASRGIPTTVIHGATIPAAAASESGLHYYKFGGTITFTLGSASHHQEVYKRIHRNLLEGQHTLLLLEYDVEKKQGAEPAFVFERLLDAEKNFKREVLSERTLAIVLARVGMEDEAVVGGTMGELRDRSFGPPPHCVIIPGRLHFTEEEALAAILKLDKKDIVDNSAGVKRTAQVLVPRYVEKARKALEEARASLKGRHKELDRERGAVSEGLGRIPGERPGRARHAERWVRRRAGRRPLVHGRGEAQLVRQPRLAAGQRLAVLDVLRAVFVANLRDGRARVGAVSRGLGATPASVRSALRDLSAKGLVSVTKGSARLTPAGRRRLKVVMLGGAFEIIHPGHLHALSEARGLGNMLVVVVATDDSVQRNKGRLPVTDQASRVALVSALRQVDLALPGNKGSIFEILVRIRPDVVALGYDQHHDGDEIVREAARRGVTTTTARLGSPIPLVKTSKILLSL